VGLTTGIRPTWRLVANSRDITDTIAARFVSLRLTDEAGLTADTLEIVLADTDPNNPVQVPPRGAELELFLGYDGQAQHMGLFVCDEVELDGWPGAMTIRARAAVYEGTPKGKTDLQTQKSRSWPDRTTLGALVQKIAKEHGMAGVLSPSLVSIVLPHYDQTEESDVSFLSRVAKRYDAVVKPAGGKLILSKRGEGKSASGDDLAAVSLTAGDVTSYRLTLSTREAPGTVVAFWHDKGMAKRQEIHVGNGDPVKQIRHHFPNAAAATAAAQAEMERRMRGQERLNLTLPGSPDLVAECSLSVSGIRSRVDGDWLVERATHSLDRGGYRCDVEAEKPNGSADLVDGANGGE
jgi:phage protein D